MWHGGLDTLATMLLGITALNCWTSHGTCLDVFLELGLGMFCLNAALVVDSRRVFGLFFIPVVRALVRIEIMDIVNTRTRVAREHTA